MIVQFSRKTRFPDKVAKFKPFSRQYQILCDAIRETEYVT